MRNRADISPHVIEAAVYTAACLLVSVPLIVWAAFGTAAGLVTAMAAVLTFALMMWSLR